MTEEQVEQQVEELIDLEQVVMGPLVQVVLDADEEPRVFPFSDLALEGDDPGLISDDDLKARCERWLDLPEGTLEGYKVNRPATGNCLVARPAVFGSYSKKSPSRCIAKLEDGSLVEYDACDKNREGILNLKVFEYIGEGVIHSIGGVEQNWDRKMHFWKRR